MNEGEVIAIRLNGEILITGQGGNIFFRQLGGKKEEYVYYLRKKSWKIYGDASFLGLAFFNSEESQNIKKQLIEIAENHFGKFN